MIKLLILYYLNIKATHGYEIQRFIQMNEMDQWTKIQSGSIYYALGKLEKEGAIVLKEEIGSGSKARKIYAITEVGKVLLKELAIAEINTDLYTVGSDKFIVFPILATLDKVTMTAELESHIKILKGKLGYVTKWQAIKIHPNSSKVEVISFEMMISNLTDQIRWHEAMISEIDQNMITSREISNSIKRFDFSKADAVKFSTAEEIEQLKQEILSNPNTASEKLEALICKLTKTKG
jgi:DNA-binding PadR family transcriptional regulator